MKRIGLVLKVRRDKIEEYKKHHQQVWPEMLDALRRNGWHNYSLFMKPDGSLFGYFETPESLETAVARIPGIVGSDNHAAWQWGNTIPLTFQNRLTLAFPFLGPCLNVGPVPQPGTQTTVKQTTPTVGPSMRMVVDFSNLENSVQNITLGESGEALSPYYQDQFDAWYHGRSFPMLFSDQAVEKNTRHELVLEPETLSASPASQNE